MDNQFYKNRLSGEIVMITDLDNLPGEKLSDDYFTRHAGKNIKFTRFSAVSTYFSFCDAVSFEKAHMVYVPTSEEKAKVQMCLEG